MRYENLNEEERLKADEVMETYAFVTQRRDLITAQNPERPNFGETFVVFTKLENGSYRVVGYDALLVAGMNKMDPAIIEYYDVRYKKDIGIVFLDIDAVLINAIASAVVLIPRSIHFVARNDYGSAMPMNFEQDYTQMKEQINRELA